MHRPELHPDTCLELLGEPEEVDLWFYLPDQDMLLRVSGVPDEAFVWLH